MTDERPIRMKRLGDPRKPDEGHWMLMPPSPDRCSQCGVDHEPDEPHNQQSLYWQYAFRAEHDRWPTWEDALAHCSDELYEQWRVALAEHGVDVRPR